MAGLALGWLAAFTTFLCWPLGSMALLLVHALTGGRWGEALRPALRLGVLTLPLALPGMLGVVLAMPVLYPWAAAGAHPANAAYLNGPFFVVRLVVYLVVWGGLAVIVLAGRGVGRVAGAGLFALALSASFAMIDLSLSLDPHFNSTIWGMLTGSEAMLTALAVAVGLRAGMAGVVIEDLGKLLLAFVILWTYLDFMQLLIVWQSDLSADAPWYVVRSTGVWGVLMAVIAVLRSVVPFAVLITPLRRRVGVVRSVAWLLVGTQVLRGWWLVLPAGQGAPGFVAVLAMVVFAGFAAALARRGAMAHG